MASEKSPRDEVAEQGSPEGGNGGAEAPAPKRSRTTKAMHADIQALVERVCDVKMMARHVETSGFDARGVRLENLTTFNIKQGLTWLRAVEQELLKIAPSPESLASLSQSCFKAVGLAGPGSQTIDSLELMKAKSQALEALTDIETVYGRLLRIAAGKSGLKKAGDSDEEEVIDVDAIEAVTSTTKRPTTPFFRFIADRRDVIAAELRKELATPEGSSVKPTLVVKRASEIYKALPEADREAWEGPYRAEKEAHEAEKAAKKAKEDAEAWEADPLHERQYRMLNCHLTPISRGSPVWRLISESALTTQPQTVAPDAHFVTVDRMFSISRACEEKNYPKQAQSQNRRLLWYGGPLASWASVLSNGLHLPQQETPFTGYSFGKGIYFSDMVSVAAARSGMADGDSAIVLLCEVALGKSVERKEVDARGASKLPAGYNSTIGRGLLAPVGSRALPDGTHLPLGPVEKQALRPPGTRLPHNEFVVYNPANIRMRYILEVKLLSGASQEAISQARAEAESLTVGDGSPLSAKRLRKKTSADATLLAS